MFEVDAALQGFEVDHLEDWLLLDLVAEDTQARKRADRRRLRLAWRFITNNQVTSTSGQEYAGWAEGLDLGDELVDTLGGEGTPLVGVDAPVQWATASGRSTISAKHYLANTMDLHVRFPLLHAQVEDLVVETWTAFALAEDTRTLSLECVRWIDARLAQTGHYGQRSRDLWVKAGIARFHPTSSPTPPGWTAMTGTCGSTTTPTARPAARTGPPHWRRSVTRWIWRSSSTP